MTIPQGSLDPSTHVMMPSIPDALHGRVSSCRYDVALPGNWKDTPWEFFVDTKKTWFGRCISFQKWLFWVSMLDLGNADNDASDDGEEAFLSSFASPSSSSSSSSSSYHHPCNCFLSSSPLPKPDGWRRPKHEPSPMGGEFRTGKFLQIILSDLDSQWMLLQELLERLLLEA